MNGVAALTPGIPSACPSQTRSRASCRGSNARSRTRPRRHRRRGRPPVRGADAGRGACHVLVVDADAAQLGFEWHFVPLTAAKLRRFFASDLHQEYLRFSDTCVACARELHEAFGRLMAEWSGKDGKPPTLSVGIAIGHRLDPMEDLLAYGRAAEKAAKDEVLVFT